MTKQELHVLEHILQDCSRPSVTTSAYDTNMQPVEVERLVAGKANHELLESEEFNAGWKACYDHFVMYLEMLTASREDQVRYAGKPRKEKP